MKYLYLLVIALFFADYLYCIYRLFTVERDISMALIMSGMFILFASHTKIKITKKGE